MKFRLFDKSTVSMDGGRAEERFHYESEDGQTRIIFNAGEEPWTWEIIGNAPKSLSEKLINKFVETGLAVPSAPNRSELFDQAIKELEV